MGPQHPPSSPRGILTRSRCLQIFRAARLVQEFGRERHREPRLLAAVPRQDHELLGLDGVGARVHLHARVAGAGEAEKEGELALRVGEAGGSGEVVLRE